MSKASLSANWISSRLSQMDGWSLAEQGEAPLLPVPEAKGGGDVSAMAQALERAVEAAERGDGAAVAQARGLADAIAANLRPPAAQTLARREARDLRAALRRLEASGAARMPLRDMRIGRPRC